MVVAAWANRYSPIPPHPTPSPPDLRCYHVKWQACNVCTGVQEEAVEQERKAWCEEEEPHETDTSHHHPECPRQAGKQGRYEISVRMRVCSVCVCRYAV